MPIDEGRSSSTKVYYYLDDNTPYLSVVPISEDLITLGDFKKVFTRKGYKYFCKQLDKAIGCEVKVEIRDDSTKLEKSANGLIELVLLSTGSTHSVSGTLPRAAARKAKVNPSAINVDQQGGKLRKRRSLHDLGGRAALTGIDGDRTPLANSNENSVTASSLSTVISKRAGEGLAELYTSNSEDPYRFDDSNSRFSMQSGACSSTYAGVPIVPQNGVVTTKAHRQRKPRKERYRKAYVPSTISSITESSLTSLSLPHIDVVTLPMKNGAPLGISVLSHEGVIFVSDIMKGGAVANDGRIEVGDQIIQVNRNSFENLSDTQAVQLLRQAAASRRPITLYVAKRPCNTDSRSDILSGLASETMPIDISLWVESAQQNNVKPLKPFAIDETNSAVEGDVTLGGHDESDIDGAYAERRDGIGSLRPAGKGHFGARKLFNAEDIARRRENEENEQLVDSLNITMDPTVILKYMARPDSGLQIKNRKWLKIPVPMSFIGRDLVDWLLDHVHGIRDRKAARVFASKLLAEGHIKHVVNKLTFTEKCYYVFEDSILSVRNTNHSSSSNGKTGAEATTEVTYVGSPAPALPPRVGLRPCNNGGPKMPPEIDQTWPLSPITVYGPAQRRNDCESPVTNDYASVIGPDVVTSTMIGASIGEAPTLKLSHRGFSSRNTTRRRSGDEILVAQPPNTPSSLSVIQRPSAPSVAGETEFEVIDDERRNVICSK